MGGQACVSYGAAEFSRDLDLALLPDPTNLDRLEAALGELEAEVIAVPPFALKHLTEGLSVHFRRPSMWKKPQDANGLAVRLNIHPAPDQTPQDDFGAVLTPEVCLGSGAGPGPRGGLAAGPGA